MVKSALNWTEVLELPVATSEANKSERETERETET